MVEHHGWRTAAVFTSEQEEAALVRQGAGLSDVSWMTKLDLKGPGLNALPAVSERARSWSLGPSHLLVTCDPDMFPAISPSSGVWVTDVTSVFAQFLLAGPAGRDVLRKLTSLNVSEKALPDSGCGQASVAHVRAIILRRVNLCGQSPLLEMTATRGRLGRPPGAAQRGQEHRRQRRDHRDDHQQFDQRECFPIF